MLTVLKAMERKGKMRVYGGILTSKYVGTVADTEALEGIATYGLPNYNATAWELKEEIEVYDDGWKHVIGQSDLSVEEALGLRVDGCTPEVCRVRDMMRGVYLS